MDTMFGRKKRSVLRVVGPRLAGLVVLEFSRRLINRLRSRRVRPRLIVESARPVSQKRAAKSSLYDDWTKRDLYAKAKELGIEGRSRMNRNQLIRALQGA
jgi:Rho termination factor, N-terminal domain